MNKYSATVLEEYPLANEVLEPVERFKINDRWCCLYSQIHRPVSHQYSLYWHGESNPIQHAMTSLEVFHVLAGLLTK